MKLKRRPPKPPKGAPQWMVTFSDLVTLILVFFILLFSMSQIDIVKFKAIAESFNQRVVFDFYPSIIPAENPSDMKKNIENQSDQKENEKSQAEKEEESLQNLLTEVQSFLDKNGLDDVIVANRTERGVVLVLEEKVLFDTGEATIVNSSNAFLDKVGGLLSNMPNLVKVEGHTDNRPISTFRYPSNWELSTARASSVVRYFIDKHQLDSERFIAVGYGDTRPIVANDSDENYKKNRRVEIVISDPKYDKDDLTSN
ncbi:flagellar motor protein MotB [Cytobacillus spongiae]|uniref:flagellar motor protein MotS n=1 Tax=Cytobacillus spongiae TaxID=2901381 RepID=UPI001F2D84E9|nr:flagellar motor protein MotS [Cytobacillus spongiae]UII55206.1 flagellar motor protein MotB [Cytobacillus spongiae]